MTTLENNGNISEDLIKRNDNEEKKVGITLDQVSIVVIEDGAKA